jgi:hypothetical protein
LQRDTTKGGEKFNERRFNYRSVTGKLNYLEKGTRGPEDIVRFSSDP